MENDEKCIVFDNWAITLLQRLQTFFNTTKYCDQTLQFNDNTQLKVHRIVLSACTSYFSMLETVCQKVNNDTLIMPDHLQADVVVPIVKFMYTGTLKFKVAMYDRLLKTAHEMNMTELAMMMERNGGPIKQDQTREEPVILDKQSGLRMLARASRSFVIPSRYELNGLLSGEDLTDKIARDLCRRIVADDLNTENISPNLPPASHGVTRKVKKKHLITKRLPYVNPLTSEKGDNMKPSRSKYFWTMGAGLCTECGYRSTRIDDLNKHFILVHKYTDGTRIMTTDD